MSEDPWETEEAKEYARQFREKVVPQITDSALFLSLVPTNDVDLKFAAELGAAIWYGKPIIVLAMPGRRVPAGLARVATNIIYADPNTPEGQDKIGRELKALVRELGHET